MIDKMLDFMATASAFLLAVVITGVVVVLGILFYKLAEVLLLS